MASLLAELQSGKGTLKATTVNDRSAAQLAGCGEAPSLDVMTETEAERRKYFFDGGIDGWYSAVPHLTYESRILPLSPSTAEAMIRASAANPKGGKGPTSGSEPHVERGPELEELRQCLDQEIAAHFPEGGFFVKLSSRSPKDSTVALSKATEAYRGHLARGELVDDNDRWIAMAEAIRQGGKCTSGEEALELLLSSERVFQDLEYAMGFIHEDQQPELWNISLVLRAWDDSCTPDREFRAFVWQRKLCCVGQYFHDLYWAELEGLREHITADAQRVFQEVVDHVPVASFMMDLAWIEPGKMVLIEVNPFDGVALGAFPASTGLFNWDRDREVMTGRAPFELRLQPQKMSPQTLRMKKTQLSPTWWSIIYPQAQVAAPGDEAKPAAAEE